MAKDDWANLRRADGRTFIVRKDAVAAFGSTRNNDDKTLLWLIGRSNEDFIKIDESEEDVARALDAA
ncbi:MAG: hypothetical protein V4707_11305 [Pseudomonadota bacterium]